MFYQLCISQPWQTSKRAFNISKEGYNITEQTETCLTAVKILFISKGSKMVQRKREETEETVSPQFKIQC